MKYFVSTIALTLLTLISVAQTTITQVKPIGVKEWGYINQTGEFVINAKYRKCTAFSDGLAAIYEGKKFMFIKPDGSYLETEVHNYKLKSVMGSGYQGFSDGMVQIVVDGKWGYLNTDGKLAVETKYTYASPFNGGVAVVKKETEFFIINKSGVETKVEIANLKDIKLFSEGLAPYHTLDKKVGFIGKDGAVVIEAKYMSVGYFVNGLAWAKKADKTIGYIDNTGNWVIEPKFLAAKNFDKESGLARVKVVDKWAYTNRTGDVMYMNTTLTWGDYYGGLAKGKQVDKWGFYDKDGNWTIKAQFEGVRDFKNGYAAAKMGGKWGVIDTNGEWVIQPQFAGIKDMELIP